MKILKSSFHHKAPEGEKNGVVLPCSSVASSLTFTALIHVLTDLCKRLTCWCYSAQALPFHPHSASSSPPPWLGKKGGTGAHFPATIMLICPVKRMTGRLTLPQIRPLGNALSSDSEAFCRSLKTP